MARTIHAKPNVANWEFVCCNLYSYEEKKAMLGNPPLTKRSIDEVVLFRAIMGKLFLVNHDALRDKLRFHGFSGNLVAMETLPNTEEGVQEAYRRAKMAFQDNYYDDEDDIDQDHGNNKVNVPFFQLLQISKYYIGKSYPFKRGMPLYYCRGDSPQVIPPEWEGTPTAFLDHVAVDNTDNFETRNDPFETFVESLSWELICRDLFLPKKRKAMLGYPPMTQRSIDEVFVYRALMGSIFGSQADWDDLWKRLILSGDSVNLNALKFLPRTEAGIEEACRRAKQAFQHDEYDDEDWHNNHRYKIVRVPFMELVKIADESIVQRFDDDARFRQHSTLYCRDDLPEVVDDLPGMVDDLPGMVDDLPGMVDDLPGMVDDLPGMVDDLPEVGPSSGDAPAPDNFESENLAKDTVKIPLFLHQNKRLFWIIMIMLVASAAIGFVVVLWNLVGTAHGLRDQGYDPQLRGGRSMQSIGQPRIHPKQNGLRHS